MKRREILAMIGGTAAGWPQVARAQRSAGTYQIAIATHLNVVDRTSGKRERYWAAFFEDLRRLGFEEGRNLAVTWHSSNLDADRAAELARAIAQSQPDVVFTPDARMAKVMRTIASAIPTVAVVFDPVGTGVADSLARPGGNVTGFAIDAGPQQIAKRLDLFRQAVPKASRMAYLTTRRATTPAVIKETRQVADRAGITLIEVILETPADPPAYRRAFAAMTQDRIDSISVAPVGESLEHRQVIAELCLGARLPTVFGYRDNVDAGGLMSYGNDVSDSFRGCATYVGRILKGAKPTDLPIQQPSKFELVINLKTAKALGLTLPTALLFGADEVIE